MFTSDMLDWTKPDVEEKGLDEVLLRDMPIFYFSSLLLHVRAI
jgi:hypothetical protein